MMYSIDDIIEHFPPTASVAPMTKAAPPRSGSASLDVNEAIRDLLCGTDWHNNMVRVVGSFVAKGWPDEAILMIADTWRLDGYSSQETLREVDAAIKGARAKGYDQPSTLPTLSTWPSAYDTFDARSIPRRRWIYGRDYLRGFVSVLASAGGIGKTSLQVVEALAIASGRPLLSEPVFERTNVWLINLEDPLEEMQLKVVAAMQLHGVTKDEVEGRLFVDAGRDFQILFAEQGTAGLKVNDRLSEVMIQKIKENNIGAVFIDPFVGSHAVNENDNMAINAVVAEIRRVADGTDSAIGLVHHVRKGNGQDADVDSVRGAGSLIGAARVARVINKVSTQDAIKLGIDEETAKSVFRVENGKANLSPPAESSVWRKMTGVQLSNGEWVGVASEYRPPSVTPISEAQYLTAQRAIEKSPVDVKVAEQAKDWAGIVVADALGFDIGQGSKKDRTHEQEIARVKVRKVLKSMENLSLLKKSTIYDNRNARDIPIYRLGDRIETAYECGTQPQSG